MVMTVRSEVVVSGKSGVVYLTSESSVTASRGFGFGWERRFPHAVIRSSRISWWVVSWVILQNQAMCHECGVAKIMSQVYKSSKDCKVELEQAGVINIHLLQGLSRRLQCAQ